jgi:hypothetical protein
MFAINQRQQDADYDHVDSHRDEEMLTALFDLVAVSLVFRTWVIPGHPSVVGRLQYLLPRHDYYGGQHQGERRKEDYKPDIKSLFQQ